VRTAPLENLCQRSGMGKLWVANTLLIAVHGWLVLVGVGWLMQVDRFGAAASLFSFQLRPHTFLPAFQGSERHGSACAETTLYHQEAEKHNPIHTGKDHARFLRLTMYQRT
jgi:hypothetical protein